MKTKLFYLFLFLAVGVPLTVLLLVPTYVVKPAVISFDENVDEQEGILDPARAGRIKDGAVAYSANGCYVCHSQLVRPTYAGTELWRKDWAGRVDEEDSLDTRRETMATDYYGESFAQIGLTRRGPDLSNVGYRIEKAAKAANLSPESYLYKHFWNPSAEIAFENSVCPSQQHLFTVKSYYGQNAKQQVPVVLEEGKIALPKEDMKALVSYLLSLKRDYEVPAQWNFAPKK